MGATTVVSFSIYLALCVWISEVRCHGRLLEPPGRASMWRFGYNSPPNYDDNQLFCGGFNRQWKINGGKCGVCGDPWDGARDHETGGKYATGTIVRHYSEGQAISVNVQITASHKGFFEFRLCPHNNPRTRVSQACLDQHVLQQTDGSTRMYEAGHPTNYTIHLKLPVGVTCSQCLLQWKYNAGNSYGCDGSHCCIGCGEQEQFYGCADVSVGSGGSASSGHMSSPVYHPANGIQMLPQSHPQPSGQHPSSIYRPIIAIPQSHYQPSGQHPPSVYQPIIAIPQSHSQPSGQMLSSGFRPINVIPQSNSHSAGQLLPSVYRPINVNAQTNPQSSGINFMFPSQQGHSIQSHIPAGYVPQNTYHVISGSLFSGGSGSQLEPCRATPRYRAVYQYADQYCRVQCSRGNCPAELYCTSACRRLAVGK